MVNKIRRLRFIIFLVGISIPFNNLAITFGRNWSVGFITTVLYFLSLWKFIKANNRLTKKYGRIYLLPLIFDIFLVAMNLFHPTSFPVPIVNTTMFLCFLFYVVMLVHSLYDSKAIDFCLWGLSFGCILMSVFFHFGIGLEIDDDMRLRMFGENSNALGIYMTIGATIILNEFVLQDKLIIGNWRYLLLIAIFPMFNMIVATASRTAILIFALSIILSLTFFPSASSIKKIIVIIIGSVFCYFFIVSLLNSDALIVERLTTSISDGNLSGRDEIWKSVLPYGMESPLLGHGETGYAEISQIAIGRMHKSGNIIYGFSPHNVLVEVFLYTGLIGIIIMSIFWKRLTKLSIYEYRISKNILPLLLLIPIYACLVSGQLLCAKWAFIIYAYIMCKSYTGQDYKAIKGI